MFSRNMLTCPSLCNVCVCVFVVRVHVRLQRFHVHQSRWWHQHKALVSQGLAGFCSPGYEFSGRDRCRHRQKHGSLAWKWSIVWCLSQPHSKQIVAVWNTNVMPAWIVSSCWQFNALHRCIVHVKNCKELWENAWYDGISVNQQGHALPCNYVPCDGVQTHKWSMLPVSRCPRGNHQWLPPARLVKRSLHADQCWWMWRYAQSTSSWWQC